MKKIPTLFERVFKNHKIIGVTEKVTPGFEWVLDGEGIATVKLDGSCCAVINGDFYKRYDCKKGKIPPEGAIACCPPDNITGHWPHWVKLNSNNPADKWYIEAFHNSFDTDIFSQNPGTYEAIGPHFQGNPYGLTRDYAIPHGINIIRDMPRDFEGIKEYLKNHNIEGVVFWNDKGPQCKIKRSDFGFKWNSKKG